VKVIDATEKRLIGRMPKLKDFKKRDQETSMTIRQKTIGVGDDDGTGRYTCIHTYAHKYLTHNAVSYLCGYPYNIIFYVYNAVT